MRAKMQMLRGEHAQSTGKDPICRSAAPIDASPTHLMMIRVLLIIALFLLAACSGQRESDVMRTINLPASKLAEIRAAPEVTVYPKGGAVSFARIGGLETDPWPPGVLLMNPDPYLASLGFAHGDMIAKIDGKDARDVFVPRWQKLRIRRPAGWGSDHYNDLLKVIFLEHTRPGMILTVYVGVPMSESEIKAFKPVPVKWRVNFER